MIFSPPYKVLGGDLSRHLHPAHLADLRESGLRDDTIQAGGVYSLAPRFIEHFFNRRGVPREIESALCFPYQSSTFARIKLFPSLGKWKYAQPPGTSARLYAPLPVNDGPLYVCEGEKLVPVLVREVETKGRIGSGMRQRQGGFRKGRTSIPNA